MKLEPCDEVSLGEAIKEIVEGSNSLYCDNCEEWDSILMFDFMPTLVDYQPARSLGQALLRELWFRGYEIIRMRRG